MKTEINYRALVPYFICIVAYIFAVIMSVTLINQTLIFEEVAASDLDTIYNYDIIGYAAASIALLIVSSYFSFKQIVIFSVIIHLFNIYDLSFSEYDERLAEVYTFICSATTLIITTILLCYIISDKKITKISGLSVFFLGSLCADFLVELILSKVLSNQASINLNQIHTLAILNIVAVVVFLLIFVFSKNFAFSVKTKTVNMMAIVKNTDVEMIYFFVIFYIFMTIFYSYEVYELTDSLLIISVSKMKYYMLLGIFLLPTFLSKFAVSYNLHKANLFCITTLLFIFLSLPFWGMNSLFGPIGWFVLGAFMYLSSCINILILAEKFKDANLKLAIILCSLASGVGYYCGYLSVYNAEEDISERGFLISICLILIGLLSYYFYVYKKNNLKNW